MDKIGALHNGLIEMRTFTPLKLQPSLSNERETIIDICPTEPIAYRKRGGVEQIGGL